jgi:Uma2 family endonuclease
MSLSTAKRFTIAEYHRLIELGFFAEDNRFELIRGIVTHRVAKTPKHSACRTKLMRELFKLIGEQAILGCQSPVTLPPDSEPEPDLVIIKNRADDYLDAHPISEDILLLIEIADSSLKYDQEVKLPLYAEAGISDYWIFNLVDNYLECYSEPYQASQGKFGYRRKVIFLPHESLNLPNFADLVLDLSKIFPG